MAHEVVVCEVESFIALVWRLHWPQTSELCEDEFYLLWYLVGEHVVLYLVQDVSYKVFRILKLGAECRIIEDIQVFVELEALSSSLLDVQQLEGLSLLL